MTSRTALVLTVIGDDRPGLVSAIAAVIEQHGGSWERSRLAQLAGKFAGVAQVEVPADAVTAVEADLAALAAQGLFVRVDAGVAAADADPPAATWRLHLLGADRPGIVAQISRTVAAHGVGVLSLESGLQDAPMAGGQLFEATAVLAVPAAADLPTLQADLESLAAELMVDLDLSE
ncbi:glycine cleavage system protein R [Nocardioides sp.]|uniref:glycine cleavage system protein R n=1 Tax=Nocardioides sp. TaxID=35761 RepID=UPI003519811A